MSKVLFNDEERVLLNSSEDRKNELLDTKELVWRLKSRAMWLDKGDNNTELFHVCTNFRKFVNTAWEMGLLDGSKLYSFKNISSDENTYFQN